MGVCGGGRGSLWGIESELGEEVCGDERVNVKRGVCGRSCRVVERCVFRAMRVIWGRLCGVSLWGCVCGEWWKKVIGYRRGMVFEEFLHGRK